MISTGDALLDQPLYIGVYKRQPELFNNKPVYAKKAGSQDTLYTYYFISEEHGVSLWVIGPDIGQFRAGIRNSGAGDCVHGLDSSWKFASRSGVWSDDDDSLSVKCHDSSADQSSLFESKKLRPRPKSFDPRPRDCAWSSWGSWSECSRSCDHGRQVRVRYHAVEASSGGHQCRGSSRDRRSCNNQSCISTFRFDGFIS